MDSVQLDEDGVRDFLERYLAALIYNLVIPIIQVRLDELGDQTVIQQRDQQLHGFIDDLVRLKMRDLDVITVDWQGEAGRTFVREALQAVYEQLEAGL